MRDAIANGKISPGLEVHRLQQHAVGDVHRTRRSQADASDVRGLQSGRRDDLPERFAHPLATIFGAAIDERFDRFMTESSSLIVNQSDLDVRSAHVDPDVERRLGLIPADELAGVGHAEAERC